MISVVTIMVVFALLIMKDFKVLRVVVGLLEPHVTVAGVVMIIFEGTVVVVLHNFEIAGEVVFVEGSVEVSVWPFRTLCSCWNGFGNFKNRYVVIALLDRVVLLVPLVVEGVVAKFAIIAVAI